MRCDSQARFRTRRVVPPARSATVLAFALMLAITTTHCGSAGENGAISPMIASATVMTDERRRIEKEGDLWANTWAANGNAYFGWGDGTGMGACYPAPEGAADSCFPVKYPDCQEDPRVVFCGDFCGIYPCDGSICYDPCTITSMGIFEQTGPISDFSGCQDECIKAIHVPNGEPQFVLGTDPSTRRGDKPTSLLALGDTLVLAGHAHMAMTILYGYIAISEDLGTTWTEIPGSPWTGGSKFKRMMFINMGRGYSLNEDGMVYGIGIASDHGLSDLYLARVPVEQVTNYDAYSYFAGFEGDGSPIFVPRDESVAAPLAGPKASMQGGVIFHPGIQRYLMLIPAKDFVLELWEAPEPWGPWFLAQRFESEAYAPAIISKDTGPDFFYFTGAGGAGIGDTYQLNISRIVMTLK